MGYSGGKWLKMVNLHIMNVQCKKNIVCDTMNYIVHIHSVKTNFSPEKYTER